ncbi:MAG: TonB-dependent receptor [Caulobacter sp.]|nr:TonB-dependent receptor [Caulobacter sp.]
MRTKCILMMSAGLLALAGGAHAQTQTKPGETTVDEVIVTAEKRTESLQDVPVAVSAYTAETRQIIGISTIQDLANFTPGLSFSGSQDRVFIRGVGRQTNTNGSDPGVATYTDGVYDASTRSVSASDFFVERVEILRGPQGTLYGRNSIGGAINAISKRPTDSFSGEIRATAGDYGVLNLEGAVSGTITDGLRARLAGARYNQDEGYFTNASGGPDEGGVGERTFAELQLEADLGPDLTAWAKIFTGSADTNDRATNYVGNYDSALYPPNSIIPGSAFGYTTAGFVAGGPATNPANKDVRRINTNTTNHQKLSDNVGFSSDIVWTLPGVDVRYIGGYQTYVFNSLSDLDDTSMESYTVPLAPGFSICAFFIPGCTATRIAPSQAFGYVEEKSFGSSEINFSSNDNGAFQWIAGVYYYADELEQQSHFQAPDLVQLRTPSNGPANPSGDFVTALSTLETRSAAAFGQVDWSFTDTLKLTAGLRYTRDEKSGFEALRVVCFGCGGFTPDQYGTSTPALDVTAATISLAAAPGVSSPVTIDPATGLARRGLSGEWSATTGAVGLEWTPDSDTLAFIKASRGYKSGGFNAGGITPLPRTNPEYVDAIELGYKRNFGSRLQVNAALYHYKYDGLQIPLTVTTAAGIALTQFFNLEESTSYGAEVEAIWRPIDPLRLSLSYGYAQSEINEACCFIDGVDPNANEPGANPVGPLVGGQQPQSLKGQQLPQTPQNKVAFSASYDIDFSAGTLTLSGNYIWRDDTYQGVFNREYTLAPAYDRVDLRAVWTEADDRYRIIAFVRNAFDEVGYDNADGRRLASPPAAADSFGVVYGITPPRTVGLQLQYRFN